MADNETTISEYGLAAPPVFRVTVENDRTVIRDYSTNAPRFVLDGEIGGGVEVMTTAERTAITPEAGQLIYDTDLDLLFVGDGETAGGVEVGSGGGGGGGATPVIGSTVTGSTATITLQNGGGNVKFVGINGTVLSEGDNGEVEIDTSQKQDVIVFNVDEFDVATTQETPSEVNSFRNRLYGKILCSCGDSITYGGGMIGGICTTPTIPVYLCNSSGVFSQVTQDVPMAYGFQIADRNRMTYYGGGVGGSTMSDVAGHNGFSAAHGRYTKLPDNIDYLTLFFGINELAYASLGTINDATNTTFYGGWNTVMPYLIEKYPNTKIGLIVPYIEGTGADGYREAVRLIGDKWGVAVFDMFQAGTPLFYMKEPSVEVAASVVSSNRAKFCDDSIHPSFAGQTQLADMIETWLYTL